MKNFLETYKHIINPVVAAVAILGLFYLGSTITPKDEITYEEPVVEVEPVVVVEQMQLKELVAIHTLNGEIQHIQLKTSMIIKRI